VDEVEAVDGLIDMARAERARSSPFSPRRAYYAGVEAAGEQVLHPDVEWVRNVHGLDRYNPAFISGYTETTALLAPLWGWRPSETTSARVESVPERRSA